MWGTLLFLVPHASARKGLKHSEVWTGRQADRQTDRQADRETDRQTVGVEGGSSSQPRICVLESRSSSPSSRRPRRK